MAFKSERSISRPSLDRWNTRQQKANTALERAEKSRREQLEELIELRRNVRTHCYISVHNRDRRITPKELSLPNATLRALSELEAEAQTEDATPAERRAKLGETVAAVVAKEITVTGVQREGENDPTQGEGGASTPEMSREDAARVAAALERKRGEKPQDGSNKGDS